MPTYVIYNPSSSPVSNLVTQLIRSFDEGAEDTLPTPRLKNPDLASVDTASPMRWNGTAVVNLSQAELDSISDAADAAYLAAVKQAAKDIFVTPAGPSQHAHKLMAETIIELVVSELNILRTHSAIGLAARNATTVKTAVRNTYEGKIDAITAP